MSYEAELRERYSAIRQRLNPDPPKHCLKIVPKKELSPQSTEIIQPKPEPKEITPDLPSGYSMRQLLKLVSEIERISILDLRSHRRQQPTVDARAIFYLLAREYSLASFPRMARFVGGRDHTTALHGYNKLKRRIETDPDAAAHVQIYRRRLEPVNIGDKEIPLCGHCPLRRP